MPLAMFFWEGFLCPSKLSTCFVSTSPLPLCQPAIDHPMIGRQSLFAFQQSSCSAEVAAAAATAAAAAGLQLWQPLSSFHTRSRESLVAEGSASWRGPAGCVWQGKRDGFDGCGRLIETVTSSPCLGIHSPVSFDFTLSVAWTQLLERCSYGGMVARTTTLL